MKTINKFIGIVIVSILFYSCSSVKVADSWKDIKTSDIKNKNVLVVTKTNNETIRVKFEMDMVSVLNDKGYKSIQSFVKFPEMKPAINIEEGQVKEMVNKLKNSGIDVVIMTVLKDVKEYTKTVTSGSSYQVISYPVYYRRGYYRGFYRHYGIVYLESDPMAEVTSIGKKYILETVVYDLTQPKDKELISVITTEIDNPESIEVVSTDFAKKIAKELSK